MPRLVLKGDQQDNPPPGGSDSYFETYPAFLGVPFEANQKERVHTGTSSFSSVTLLEQFYGETKRKPATLWVPLF